MQSLANMQSDVPIETSLMGTSFEGSLANAPFSTSMTGVSFVTNLAGAPFETSMAGVPFGTSMVGNPFGISMASSSFGMSLAGAPFETSQEDDSPGMAQRDNRFEMMLVDTPLTTRLLERWEHISDEPARTTDTLTGGLHSGGLPHAFRNTKYSIPAFWLGKPRKRSIRVHWFPQLRGYLGNLLRRAFAQDRGYSSFILWLVLAMTITVLIGGIVSDTFLVPPSSGRNNYHKQPIIIDTKDIPIDTRRIAQPVTHGIVTPATHKNSQKEIYVGS